MARSASARGAQANEVYRGLVRPGAVGWTRIALTVGLGLIVAIFARSQAGDDGLVLAAVIALAFGLYGLLMWMRLHVTFLVDERGVTPSLGGFWPVKTWPLDDFRTVQLRHVPAEHVGSTVGNIGLRTGYVTSSLMKDVTAVAGMKPRTLVAQQAPATYAVTGGGALVEIITINDGIYLLSPTSPRECAEAIAAHVKARR